MLLCLLFLSPAVGAVFAPSYDLTGTLTDETQAFFIGKTAVRGTFSGYPMDDMLKSSLAEDMGGFPLIGKSSLSDLDTVIVCENFDITTAESLEDILDLDSTRITTYTDVGITTEDGLFLLGIHQGNLTVSEDLSYAVTTFLPLEIIENSTTRFFVTVANTPLAMHGSGDYAVLTTLSETGDIHVSDGQGRTVWSGSSPDTYLIIQNTDFSITQHPPLALFPLTDMSLMPPLTLSVSPARPEDVTIDELIGRVSEVIETLGQDTSSDLFTNISQFDNIVQTSSLVANGAMVFLRTNDTLTIDRSAQQTSSTGFIRFRTLDLTTTGSSSGPTLQADCKLCFLGDHFYNPRAQQSSDGIAFPFEVLIIWVCAVCVFVYVRFFARPPVDPLKDQRIQRYALIVHLIALIVAFLLVDIEVNDLFGISALSTLFTQGASAVTGVFLFLEALLWVLGYLLLAIPIQLLTYALLRYLGYGKGGNGVRKAVGDLSIWVFCGLYLLLLTNFILSLLDFNTLVPMG